MLLRIAGFVSGGAATPFEEVSANSADTAVATDPRDATITVPTGTGRYVFGFVGFDGDASANSTTGVSTFDPGGANQTTLTKDESVDAAADNNTIMQLFGTALGAGVPDGSETLRYDQADAGGNPSKRGPREIVIVRGAGAYSTGSNGHDANTALTVTINRDGGGNFPTGSLVYAALYAEATGVGYAVSGNATEVRDIDCPGGNLRRYVFAKGTLGSPAASASVTFTRDGGAVVVQKAAVGLVVETA